MLKIKQDFSYEAYHSGIKCTIASLSQNRITRRPITRWSQIEEAVRFLILILILLYSYLYIYPPDSQESDRGAIHRVSNYPDLLPEIPSYCCPLVI